MRPRAARRLAAPSLGRSRSRGPPAQLPPPRRARRAGEDPRRRQGRRLRARRGRGRPRARSRRRRAPGRLRRRHRRRGDRAAQRRSPGRKFSCSHRFQPKRLRSCSSYRLTPVISSIESLSALKAFSKGMGWTAPLHLKFDTGMTRLGIDAREALSLFELLRSSPELRLEGVMSHLAEAETPDSESNRVAAGALLGSAVAALSSGAERAASRCTWRTAPGRCICRRRGTTGCGWGSRSTATTRREGCRRISSRCSRSRPRSSRSRRFRRGPGSATAGAGSPSGRAGSGSCRSATPTATPGGWAIAPRCSSRGRRVPVVGSVSMDLLAVDVTGVDAEVGSRPHAPRSPGRRSDLGGRARCGGRNHPLPAALSLRPALAAAHRRAGARRGSGGDARARRCRSSRRHDGARRTARGLLHRDGAVLPDSRADLRLDLPPARTTSRSWSARWSASASTRCRSSS